MHFNFNSIRTGAAALGLFATLVVAPLSASAAPLPPSTPSNATPAARTAWYNQWMSWIGTSIAENSGYWQPILRGRFAYTPGLKLLPTMGMNTACGVVYASDGAEYCRRDMTIYVSVDYLEQREQMYGRGTAQRTLAHEFGHHIQNLQGLPFQGMYTELQADCLAGAALASMSNAEHLNLDQLVPTLLAATNSVGDPSIYDRDHGTGYERMNALADGWTDLSRCNLTDPSGYYYPTFSF
jgi:predicted metalloprotease